LTKQKIIPLEERRAQVLIKSRHYKVTKKEELKNAKGIFIKTPKGKSIIYCVPTEGTVGVAYINQLVKLMQEKDLENGIVVTNGKYTQAARKKARSNKIELIPKIFPVFDLFEHDLVPKHEILSDEERAELLSKYRVEPYQLPKIKKSDPAVIAVGAEVGDIVKIFRESPTAGSYVAYRYVVGD
jgi:DNA-directed RNA polymerase subunit H (RpoH/RPB5)